MTTKPIYETELKQSETLLERYLDEDQQHNNPDAVTLASLAYTAGRYIVELEDRLETMTALYELVKRDIMNMLDEEFVNVQ